MPATLIYPTPEDVETAFYKAIVQRDLIALMSVWAEDDEIICIHPTGAHLSGFAAIQTSWRSILGGSARMEIRRQRVARWNGMLISVHHMIEHLHLNKKVNGPIQATHIYLRGPHGWRLTCRHASPGGAPMLIPEKERRVLH
ncbi:MAG: nuclear transport factor 2 family protein [Zoogloeaceae bacterium]|jgi:ketosteroid isomerase-like protein|nr:nuclear transport factor 2 family protein [Zoogloeaceae bacterium]